MGSGACPCGTGVAYDGCCGRFHRSDAAAPTAERLMRSRYSAFVVEDEAYLRRTWHPSTCPKRINVGDGTAWSGLTIHATGGGGLLDRDGIVDFTAARHDGQPVAERSAFTKLDGRWVYVGPA